jgi:hypothetical protein
MLLGFILFLAIGLIFQTGCTQEEAEGQAEIEEKEEPETTEKEVELPAAVSAVVEAYFPDAKIDFVEVVEEYGFTLYDIEFKEDRGEIEVTEDGNIIDVVTILKIEDLPEAAAQAIQAATEGMSILRLEKSEIHSEFKKEGDKNILVKLDIHKFVYEAELTKDDKRGEITVDADGNVVEPLKWDTN